jgi:hypothetical protein
MPRRSWNLSSACKQVSSQQQQMVQEAPTEALLLGLTGGAGGRGGLMGGEGGEGGNGPGVMITAAALLSSQGLQRVKELWE